MRIRTLCTLAATAAVTLAGVAASAPSALASTPYDNAVLQIKTQAGLALDVAGASKGDGAPVIQWTQNFNDNQRWHFVPVGGHLQIRAVHSNKCLTAMPVADGPSPVVQWVCNPSRLNQQWDVEPGTWTSDVLNGLTIRSVADGLPLTVPGYGSPVPGRQLVTMNSRLGDDPGQIFDFTTSVR